VTGRTIASIVYFTLYGSYSCREAEAKGRQQPGNPTAKTAKNGLFIGLFMNVRNGSLAIDSLVWRYLRRESSRVMEPPPKPSSTSLFQVYLRLRPPPSPLVQLTQQSLYPLLAPPERYLTVEPSGEFSNAKPTHITIHPPSDSRKRAVEKFAFTKVFEEEAGQLEIFKETGVVPLVEGVLGEARDGLLATLGVTGSGKV